MRHCTSGTLLVQASLWFQAVIHLSKSLNHRFRVTGGNTAAVLQLPGVVFKFSSHHSQLVQTEALNCERLQQNDELVHRDKIVKLYRHLSVWHFDVLVLKEEGTRTLKDYTVAGGKHLSEPGIRQCFEDLLRVLHEMHETARLVHRDIKPENICYGRQICLIDLGSAASLDESTNWQSGSTNKYDLPEMLLSETSAVSVAQDLYPLAVIVYELFEHRFPFADSTQYRTLQEYLDNISRTRNVHRPFVHTPKDLRPVLTKMLSRRRFDRYPTAEAVLHALGISI